MDLFLQTRDPKTVAIFAIIVLWTVFWKGLALWHSSRRDNRIWFVILLIISTLGIMEIVYLFFVIKLKPNELFRNEKIEGKASDAGSDATEKADDTNEGK